MFWKWRSCKCTFLPQTGSAKFLTPAGLDIHWPLIIKYARKELKSWYLQHYLNWTAILKYRSKAVICCTKRLLLWYIAWNVRNLKGVCLLLEHVKLSFASVLKTNFAIIVLELRIFCSEILKVGHSIFSLRAVLSYQPLAFFCLFRHPRTRLEKDMSLALSGFYCILHWTTYINPFINNRLDLMLKLGYSFCRRRCKVHS